MIEKAPQYLYKVMSAIFAGILSLTVFISNYYSATALVYAILLSFMAVKLCWKYKKAFDTWSDTGLLVALSIVCFVVKFLWVYFMRMEPQSDYATFYYSAVNLSKSWCAPDRYIALFPHIFGYSVFLSFFFTVFGESVFLALLLNVVLTVVSGILIFKIVRELVSVTAAVCSYCLWIICPSQTIYNGLVLSDPLYTTLILAYIYILIIISRKEKSMNWKQMIFYGVLTAIILQGINVNRPIAMVLIIATFIWIVVFRFKELFQKDYWSKWLPFFSVMLAVYFSLGSFWNMYFTSRIGEAPASVPGHTINVGFNVLSNGEWNAGDSELLFSYNDQEGATAEWVQQQMLSEAVKRITSGTIDFPQLMKNKLSVFLGKDSVCVDYCSDIIRDKEFFSMACNAFYYCMVLLSILGAYKMLRISHGAASCILPLYVIGLTCAQMLVEVAPRYHYSVIPILMIVSQFYLFKEEVEA